MTRANDGRSMRIVRGDTLQHEFYPYFDDVSDVVEIWFTVKDQKSCDDNESLLQVSLTNGLLVVNKTPATVAVNGSIAITADGRCSVFVDAVETAKLPTGLVWYDVQLLFVDGTIETPILTKCHITNDVTLATS